MSKRKILLQLDPDPQPSVFDAVVAVDAGADMLLRHGGVSPEGVRDLVHGCIFTRGMPDLQSTAIFIGGSNVAAGEKLLAAVTQSFFGPMRVSVMLDANGANTTAAAAVLAVLRHVKPVESAACVLAGTGPVGQRVARLLAAAGVAEVRVGSRRRDKAEEVVAQLAPRSTGAKIVAVAAGTQAEVAAALQGTQVVVAAGAAGIELLSAEVRTACKSLRVAVDLNAVPPLGIAGVSAQDKAADRDGCLTYGALGVGGTKMKIHRAALAMLFEKNDLVLDADEIFALGQTLA